MSDNLSAKGPEQRKVVFVLRQLDIDKLSLSDHAADILDNEEVHVLRYPPQQPDEIELDLVRRGIARPGKVLVQSPFDSDVYRDSAQVVEDSALDKYFYFSRLCQLLGAKKISVEQITLKDHERKISVDAKANYKVVNAEAKVNIGELDAFREKIVLEDAFPGDSPDIEAAQELIARTGLSGDTGMRSLVDLRRGSKNPIKSRHLRVNMTTETNRSLSVLAGIAAGTPGGLAKVMSLEAAVDRVLKERKEFTVTIKVDF